MISTLVLVSAIILFVYAFYKWATINNDYFKRRSVKSMKPELMVGNSGFFFGKTSILDVTIKQYNEFPDES